MELPKFIERPKAVLGALREMVRDWLNRRPSEDFGKTEAREAALRVAKERVARWIDTNPGGL